MDARLIAEFDGGPALPAPPTWTGLFRPWAGSDAPAVRQAGGDLSYRDLMRMAGAAAALLDEHGVAAGGPVPALLDSGPVALALWLAGSSSRRPIAPLGPRGTVAEVVACIQAGDAKVLLASPPHRALGEAAAAAVGARCVVVDSLGEAEPPDLGRATPDDIACILHTSGTTGAPKRILVRQRALAARVRAYIHALAVDEHSVYASAASFHHAAGVPFLVVALGAGAAVAPMPTTFSIGAWRKLGSLGVTHSNVVPSMLGMLLDADALDAMGLRLQTLLYGASRIEPEQIRRTFAVLPDVRLVQGYGQAEGGPHTVLDTADHRLGVSDPARAEILTSCGRPAPGVRIRIVGESGTSEGPVGVVQVRSPQVFSTGDDGWLTTGDLGHFDADGYLYLVGRTGDGFVRGGENIYPAEIERALMTHPGVRDVAVVGVPDTRLGQTVGALVVPADPSRPPATTELHSHVRHTLAGFKVPAVWEFLPELPRNQAGKLLRNRLPTPKDGLDRLPGHKQATCGQPHTAVPGIRGTDADHLRPEEPDMTNPIGTSALRFGTFVPPYHTVGGNPTLLIRRDLDLAAPGPPRLRRVLDGRAPLVRLGDHRLVGAVRRSCRRAHGTDPLRRRRRLRALPPPAARCRSHAPARPPVARTRDLRRRPRARSPSIPTCAGIAQDALRPRQGEGLNAITRLLRGEVISMKTGWFELREARCQLLPFAPEGIELVVGSPTGSVYAGRLGDSLLALAAGDPVGFSGLTENWEVYDKTAAEYGNIANRAGWRCVTSMFLAETREEAARAVERHVMQVHVSVRGCAAARPSCPTATCGVTSVGQLAGDRIEMVIGSGRC